jgi:hypothetical protein
LSARAKVSPWPFVGMAGLAAAFFLYAVSGVVAPGWALTVLMFVWLVLFVTACRWWTPYPGRLPLLAVGAVAFWFAFIAAGGAWLGWCGVGSAWSSKRRDRGTRSHERAETPE